MLLTSKSLSTSQCLRIHLLKPGAYSTIRSPVCNLSDAQGRRNGSIDSVMDAVEQAYLEARSASGSLPDVSAASSVDMCAADLATKFAPLDDRRKELQTWEVRCLTVRMRTIDCHHTHRHSCSAALLTARRLFDFAVQD
jgi:hypothetical protein